MENWKADHECIICTMVPRKMKILSCLNGHDICEFCFDRLGREVCPLGDCSYGIPGSRVRCLKLEKPIENVDFVMNCIYVREGCVVEGLRKDLGDDETACDYREVHCPQLLCGHKLPLKMLQNHLEEQHRFRNVQNRGEGWNEDRLGFFSIELQELQTKASGADFVRAYQFEDGSGRVYTNFHLKNRTLFVWLTVECSPTEARKYKGNIRLSNPITTDFRERRCPVNSIDTPPSEVLRSGANLEVSGPCLEELWVPSPESQEVKCITISFKIENK